MFDSLLQFIERLITLFGPFGIFVASFLEETIVPVPSTIVMTLSGAALLRDLSGTELMTALFFKVALPGALGFTLGAAALYAFFHMLGKPGIVKYGHFFNISWEEVEKFSERLSKSILDEFLLFFFRAVPFAPNIPATAFCGVVRWRFSTFLLSTFLGTLLRSFFLGWLGAYLGKEAKMFADAFGGIEDAVLLLVILCFAGFLIWRRKSRV